MTVDKKEIAGRVVAFSAVYVLVAVAAASYLERLWILPPLVFLIVVWSIYVYRMNVRVLGMPIQSMGLEGAEGKALTDIHEEGKVKVKGEIWNSRSTQKIKKGKKVRILSREGITLEVEPVED